MDELWIWLLAALVVAAGLAWRGAVRRRAPPQAAPPQHAAPLAPPEPTLEAGPDELAEAQAELARIAEAAAAEREAEARERAEQARVEADRRAAEQAEQAEQQRLAAEREAQAELERELAARAEAERAEAERLAAEQAEAERTAEAAARAQAERAAAEAAARAEAQRQEALRAQAERHAAVQAEQAERDRLAAERAAAAERERDAAVRAEAERLAAEQAEAERLAHQHSEAERAAAEQAALARLAEQRASQAMPPAAPEAKRPAQTLVLVADDSKVVRIKTGRLLAQHQYQVSYASDGLDAVQQLQAQAPDVVITDVEMPGMDGFELTRHIRSQEHRALPVIMITAADERHREQAEQAGVSVLLGKPYPEDALICLAHAAETSLPESESAHGSRQKTSARRCTRPELWLRFALDRTPSGAPLDHARSL
jgi:CheY-like chemotaxis protein